jgi:hypothetical protein
MPLPFFPDLQDQMRANLRNGSCYIGSKFHPASGGTSAPYSLDTRFLYP